METRPQRLRHHLRRPHPHQHRQLTTASASYTVSPTVPGPPPYEITRFTSVINFIDAGPFGWGQVKDVRHLNHCMQIGAMVVNDAGAFGFWGKGCLIGTQTRRTGKWEWVFKLNAAGGTAKMIHWRGDTRYQIELTNGVICFFHCAGIDNGGFFSFWSDEMPFYPYPKYTSGDIEYSLFINGVRIADPKWFATWLAFHQR